MRQHAVIFSTAGGFRPYGIEDSYGLFLGGYISPSNNLAAHVEPLPLPLASEVLDNRERVVGFPYDFRGSPVNRDLAFETRWSALNDLWKRDS